MEKIQSSLFVFFFFFFFLTGNKKNRTNCYNDFSVELTLSRLTLSYHGSLSSRRRGQEITAPFWICWRSSRINGGNPMNQNNAVRKQTGAGSAVLLLYMKLDLSRASEDDAGGQHPHAQRRVSARLRYVQIHELHWPLSVLCLIQSDTNLPVRLIKVCVKMSTQAEIMDVWVTGKDQTPWL